MTKLREEPLLASGLRHMIPDKSYEKRKFPYKVLEQLTWSG